MHLDNKVITNGDLCNVFERMPFTAYDDENKNSHKHLIRQFMEPTSHVHNSKVEAAAIGALKRIREYQGDAKVLTLESRQILAQIAL
jgi:5-methylthioribose kinase